MSYAQQFPEKAGNQPLIASTPPLYSSQIQGTAPTYETRQTSAQLPLYAAYQTPSSGPGYTSYPIYNGQPQIIYVQQQPQMNDEEIIGIVLFVLGFFFVITWWVGACCIDAKSPRAKVWQTVNRVFTGISLAIIAIYMVIIVVALNQLKHHPAQN